ncbi:MAG: SAM-dependent methyltransferase [Acidimicrobiaceae bacterium]|nr:SAM-dependent methyltransferase [Acidimicrobiaceae bacterium]
MDATTWDERYRDTELMWSAGPNGFVEEICSAFEPGRSIDLAAGEGRNALWLAEQGWDSTAVDFSAVAIDKARAIAERSGLTITTEVADLTTYVPTPGGFDLVVIAYLQLPSEQLAPILQRAAEAVAPGGHLVLVNHDLDNLDHGYGGPPSPDVLTTPAQVVGAIGDTLIVERAETVDRHVQTDAGEHVARDTVVVAHRP